MLEKKSHKMFCFFFFLRRLEMQIKSASIGLAKIFERYHLWRTGPLFSECSFTCCPIEAGFATRPASASWCVLVTYRLLDSGLDHMSRCNQRGINEYYFSTTLYVSVHALLSFTPLAHLHTCLLHPCLSLGAEHAGGIRWRAVVRIETWLISQSPAEPSAAWTGRTPANTETCERDMPLPLSAVPPHSGWCATWRRRCKS